MPQQCTSCSTKSPDGAKFCLECGTPFARSCPTCGHPASRGKFCMECGTPLSSTTGPPATAPPVGTTGSQPGGPVSERRTTTVLFGDLVSFTTLSESRDPEEVRELLSEYFAVARTVVGRYGGTIEKFIGDAVMAVWGVPLSHEDDAERAIRAGLDIVAEVAALGARVGAPELSMRVGVVTGSVAVTLGAVNEGMVAGDAVNTAARVQTAAAPGTVWTDQETRGLTAAAIAYTDMGEHILKGKAEPARLFRADAIVAAVGGAQRVDGLEAAMTGREPEMRQVKELFHATQTDGRSRIVLVSGMPGVGKSRLGWEFEKYTDGLSDGVKWHRGRCLSYGDGVAYWAFSEMVRSRLGLLENEEAAEVRAKVRSGVDSVADGPDEAEWLRPRLEALLGVGDGVAFERTDLFAAWTTLVDRVGSDEPVVLLFEDMQHADTGLLDLVEHLLETARAKLFVLVLTRPELLDARPSLAAGRRATVIDLERLSDDAMTALVDGLVSALPDRARTAIVGRSEGIPLYAVETVRSLIDRDVVVARDGRYVFVDHEHRKVDLDQLAAPTSLQTLIAARLDTLTPVERRTVQDASVLGMAFRHAGLMALSDVSSYELDGAISGLIRRGVIQTQDDPRSPERGQYRFLQAMVREVAYSTLARKDRRTRHLAAAAHLQGEDGADALAGIISQHLVDALDATTLHDPERADLTHRARVLLTSAAERAESLGSPKEAFDATMSALGLDPDPEERVALQERGARTAQRSGENARAEELAAHAVAAYDAVGRNLDAVRVIAVQARSTQGLGRTSQARDLALDGLNRLDAFGDDPILRVDLLRVLTFTMRFGDDPAEYRERVFEQMRVAEELGDPGALVSALNGLAVLCVDMGSPTAYVALMERCTVIARESRILDQLARSLANLLAEIYPNDLQRARSLADEAVTANHQVGDYFAAEVGLINAASTWWLAGEWDRLESELTEWLDSRPTTSSTGVLRQPLGQLRLARGQSVVEGDQLPDSEDAWEQHGADLYRALVRSATDPVEAAASAAASARTTYGSGEMLEDFEIGWAPAVELQLQAGALEEAEALLGLATPMLGGRSRPLTRGEVARLRGTLAVRRGGDAEDDLRTAERELEAYGAPYLLALTRLELGRWLATQGRRDEAVPLLEAAREVFVRLGAIPSIGEVDAVVHETADALV
jgi:class 3 adenylate cyclase/tetratricopeptide (TPR) repeat protein